MPEGRMISVIIVNYNSASLTRRAVESVFQEHEEIEVFVVDNTSTSEEQRQLQDMVEKQNLTLIFNEENVGFAKACNQAFALSRGKYIFLLNPDAYVIPSCLGILREFMEKMPDVSSVSPLLGWDWAVSHLFPYTFLPSPLQDFLIRLSQLSFPFGYLYSLYIRRKNIRLWESPGPVKAENLSGGTVMVRRSAIEDIGGLFDEQFFLFYEDNDLFLRLKKAGYSFYIIPAAKAVHSYSHSAGKLDVMARSQELYFNKHFSRNLLRRISGHLPGTPRKSECAAETWSTPPVFSVPPELRKRYLFEWSPNRFFFPAIGYFGRGETFLFSEEVWHSLDKGNYYGRFSDDQKMFCSGKVLCWKKIEE